jgi:hypothetical protein
MSDPVVALFQREIDRDHVADSYLLIGNSRLRLRQLAMKFGAMALGCQGPVEEHSDFLLLDPEEMGVRGLKVEHIAARQGSGKSLEEALKYKPLRGQGRAVVLLQVDRMTPDAQAAFLKTAEEPPEGTRFFLTATDQTAILPALLSRCRTYRVSPPSMAEVERRAAAKGIEGDDLQDLIRATGHAEMVLDLRPTQRTELVELKAELEQWLQDPTTPLNWLAAVDGTLAEQREKAQLRLSACLGWMVGHYQHAGSEQARRLDHMVKHVSQALADISAQVTPSIVLEQLFLRVQRP